jgi:hypothetical protein
MMLRATVARLDAVVALCDARKAFDESKVTRGQYAPSTGA